MRWLIACALLTVACHADPSSSAEDAGPEGPIDAGGQRADAGTSIDAGGLDAGAVDAGAGDAGSPAEEPLRVSIPGDTALDVQEMTGAGETIRVHELARIEVVATGHERRVVSLKMPVRYVDDGAASPADRLYHQADVSCIGDGGPFTARDPADGRISGTFSQVRNLLANDEHTLAPRVIVEFPEAGTYTCRARYVLRTSRDFTHTTDHVLTGEGGYLEVSAPIPSWAERCYWPTAMDAQPAGCTYASGAPEALIPFGASLIRTPIEVVVPHGATAVVRADASLSTCAGTGGASAHLCPDGVTSELSKVRSRIIVEPLTETRPECQATLEERDPVWTTIISRVHHAPITNQRSLTAPEDPSCDTRYRILQELTVTSGAPTRVHGNGTTLFVTDL